MEQNKLITAKEAIEQGLCSEIVKGKIKWLVEINTNRELLNTSITSDFKGKLLVSPDGKILGIT